MRVLLSVTALLWAACGGEHGSWIPDDLDTSTTIDRLGAAGYARLCDAFAEHVRDQYRSDRLVQAACVAHALDTTIDAVACGEASRACIEEVPAEVETLISLALGEAGCSMVPIDPAACGASVSSLTRCLDAMGQRVDAAQYGLACAALGSPVPPDWYMLDLPAECAALGDQC